MLIYIMRAVILLFNAFSKSMRIFCITAMQKILMLFEKIYNQSRTNGPINAHLTIGQV